MKITALLKYLYLRWSIKHSIRNNGGIVGDRVKISVLGDFVFGENVILNSRGIDLPRWSHISVRSGALLEIGHHSGLSQFVIDCNEHIKIGNYVNIGAGCLIMDSNFHNTDWNVRRNRELDHCSARTAPIIIGDDVFVGARSIICKGVTIGARSIIAAGSVVVNDIPADCIAGGNPCRVIKFVN